MTPTRPRTVLILGWLFIFVGGIALASGLLPLVGLNLAGGLPEFQRHGTGEFALMIATRAAAVIGGVFLLRGANWARWLLVAWMAFHLVLSFFHSMTEVLMHAVLFGLVGYLLFRPDVTAYLTSR
jgi:hypothetical protein